MGGQKKEKLRGREEGRTERANDQVIYNLRRGQLLNKPDRETGGGGKEGNLKKKVLKRKERSQKGTRGGKTNPKKGHSSPLKG